MKNIQAFILAAGRSTRMQDPVTKMLHDVGQYKILERTIRNLQNAGISHITLIVGHQKDLILSHFPDFAYIVQEEQKGTGHAVQCARPTKQAEHTLVAFGDKPLFKSSTIREFVESHLKSGAMLTASTVIHPIPENYSEGYGAVIRDKCGKIMALENSRKVFECDGGIYLFNTDWLWANIHRLVPHTRYNGKVEYFIPDMIALAVKDEVFINEYRIQDYREAIGINHPAHKLEAEQYLKEMG